MFLVRRLYSEMRGHIYRRMRALGIQAEEWDRFLYTGEGNWSLFWPLTIRKTDRLEACPTWGKLNAMPASCALWGPGA